MEPGGIFEQILDFGNRADPYTLYAELARRLVNPRLVNDPPPYRPSPTLRGPRHLTVEFDRVLPPGHE